MLILPHWISASEVSRLKVALLKYNNVLKLALKSGFIFYGVKYKTILKVWVDGRHYQTFSKISALFLKVCLGSAAVSVFWAFWVFFFKSSTLCTVHWPWTVILANGPCWTVINRKKKKKFIVFSFQQNKLYPKRTLKHKHQLTLFDSPLAYLA